ncbi:predicted protein [Nematostella vectensis]|uniref:EF-hand domain-containing protein n=1 Tax=Nematostella vectensis TaxID=45351 RepID=A7SIU0_NEMVE|nr:predicted protein [Nematostella vectensis]|eukprot:XP_001628422.1 predicted protein [Nematostella vectensis]
MAGVAPTCDRNATIERVDKTLRVLTAGGLRGHLGRQSGVTSAQALLSDGSDSDEEEWDTDLEGDEQPKSTYDPTGRTLYLRACNKLGIVPASYFVRHMTNPEMTMMHHGLGPVGVQAISLALLYNTTITVLNIRDNGIGEEGGEIIAKLLRENYYITELDISENQVGARGTLEIAETLKMNNTLTKLGMAGNDLSDKEAALLCSALLVNSTVTRIDLSGNKFSNKACEYIGALLDESYSLEYLDLSWNHIQVKGAQRIAKGLEGNMKLKTLKLAWNGVATDGAIALAKSLEGNTTLVELDLSSNRVGDEGAIAFARTLKNNSSLESLYAAKNNITENGACSLLNAVMQSSGSTMIKIDLTGAILKDDFHSLVEELKIVKPEMVVVTDICPEPRSRADTPDPSTLLRNYLAREHVRVVDLFRRLDKDQSMQVSVREFVEGLRKSDVGLTAFEVEKIIESLDVDDDGEIDYSEFVSIQGMWKSPESKGARSRRASRKI